MSALPVWPTTKAVLTYCWRERGLALRYSVVPVLALILLDVGGTLAGIDIAEDRAWQFISAAASLLAYAPLLVTWYAGVESGTAAARTRPMFTFGQREVAVAITNVLVLLMAGLALLCFGLGVEIVGAGVYQINALAAQVVTVMLAIAAVFLWLMLLTRLSVAIAFAAAGRHITMRDSWRVTRGVAVSFTWLHIILGTIGIGIDTAATGIVGAVLQVAGFAAAAPILNLAVSATDTIFTIAYLLLATTLFGMVYRRVGTKAAAPAP